MFNKTVELLATAAILLAAAGCSLAEKTMNKNSLQMITSFENTAFCGNWQQKSDRLLLTNQKRETICPAEQEPGFQTWCSVWKEPDGSLKLAFTEVIGDLTKWPPSYDFYDEENLKSIRKIYVSKDGGRSWQYTGKSWDPTTPHWQINSDPKHMHMVRLPDGRLMRTDCDYNPDKLRKTEFVVYDEKKAMQPITFPFSNVPAEVPDVRPCFKVSSDEGATWQMISKINTPCTSYVTGFHRLKNGMLVVTGALIEGPLPWGYKGMITESPDDGKTWSTPQVYAVNNDLVRGICEESDFVELDDGSLLIISRVVCSDGKDILTRVKRDENGKWNVLEQRIPENFIRTGYPAVYRASDGTIFHDRGTSLLYSCDDGKTWEPVELGCTYYGKIVEAEANRILSISQNNIADSSFPWRHDAGITQCAFTYRRYQVWASHGDCGTLKVCSKNVQDCHLATAVELDKSAAIIYGSDAENGCFARLVNHTFDGKKSLFFEMGKVKDSKMEVLRRWCLAPTPPQGKFEIQIDRQGEILKAAVKLFDGSWASHQDPPFYLAIPIEKDLMGKVFIKLEGKGEVSDIRFAEKGGISFRENWQKPEDSSKSIELDAGRSY